MCKWNYFQINSSFMQINDGKICKRISKTAAVDVEERKNYLLKFTVNYCKP